MGPVSDSNSLNFMSDRSDPSDIVRQRLIFPNTVIAFIMPLLTRSNNRLSGKIDTAALILLSFDFL